MEAKSYDHFDDIYTKFIKITKVDEFELPQTPDGMYDLVEEGIDLFNNFSELDEIELDRDTEILSREISAPELNLIANYMKLIIYEGIYSIFVSTYDVLQSDLGIRNYKSQADARMAMVNGQRLHISKLLLKIMETFETGE